MLFGAILLGYNAVFNMLLHQSGENRCIYM